MTGSEATRAAGHEVRTGPVAASGGLAAVTLTSPAGLSASFVPRAGMVGCALTLDGQELLGLRGGMPAYLSSAKTFGIPLLAPWANRLGPDTYRVAGQECTVAGVRGVHRDEHGTAIHGLLAGADDWRVIEASAQADSARLAAQFRFDHDCAEFDAFPFPHLIDIVVELSENELAVSTTVTPLSDAGVPVAFGWHPYFTVPGVPREQWLLSLPFSRRALLDERNLPTGEVVDWTWTSGDGPRALGTDVLDDLFVDVEPGARAELSGVDERGRGVRIAMVYTSGYSYGVAFAPAAEDVVAIEPMTAPTAPFSGEFGVIVAHEPYEAVFTVMAERI